MKTNFARLLLSLCLLPFFAHAESSAWISLVRCRKAEGNLILPISWNPDSGLPLLIRSRQTSAEAKLTIDRRGLAATAYTAPAENASQLQSRVFSTEVLQTPREAAELTIKFREADWTVYLDGQLAASVPAPFEPPADVLIPQDNKALLTGKVRFRPVPREAFRSDFMIEEGAPNQLYPWKPESGDWRIHTALDNALDRPESNLPRIKQVPLTADKSPNFYSLKGSGKKAILTTGYNFFDDYDYSAAVHINAGEAGLVFYHQDAENYYTFTINLADGKQRNGIVELRRVRNGKETVLARAKAELFTQQWYMPQVRVHTNEIVCLIDKYPILTVEESLPIGGKIGLYVDHEKEIRFDDARLDAFEQIPLRNAGEIQYQTLRTNLPETNGKNLCFTPKAGGEQFLILGRPHHKNTIFTAGFQTDGDEKNIGLIAGFRSDDLPYYRFTTSRNGNEESFRLEEVSKGEAKEIEAWSHENPDRSPAKLTVDATGPDWIRFLKNDRLAIVIGKKDNVLSGASGIWTKSPCTIDELKYDFVNNRYHERLQTNKVFAKDNFMRHWSSAEGQWIAGKGGHLWHKGDFFSDFSIKLPCIPGTSLHLGIPEGEKSIDGPIIITVGDKKLSLDVALDPQMPTHEEAPLVAPEGKLLNNLSYTVHHEGYWIWVSVEGKTLLRHRLSTPLSGTRVRVGNLTLASLARSRVIRTNVIDDFFAESPHDWLINGGNWQIVNRFQCTPSWSHMIGESADTMAGLWYKSIFTGDMTLEFYAGTRHGVWYQRTGDLNCTMMGKTTSPNSGYTVTCTEWDQNLSQKWSTLHRNGKILDRSDKYLVPRRRKGNVRHYRNPLVSAGRDVHGAWYYIKLRKIGTRLEYYFDNELIFSTTDPEVLREGLLGIWTFCHSMTLAQIKMTFQHIRPRPIPYEILPTSTLKKKKERTCTAPALLLNDSFPRNATDKQYWSIEDPVGHASLQAIGRHADALQVTNHLGSGNMFAATSLPPLPLAQTAGWRMQIKRSTDAQFNIHFTTGRLNAQNAYVPIANLFHRVSGTDFQDGGYQMTGETGIAAGEWTTIDVWIPENLRNTTDAANKILVRLEGIGNRQPSKVQCGLGGNPPNSFFAVRKLQPLFYAPPKLSAADQKTPLYLILKNSHWGKEIIRAADLADVSAAVAAQKAPGIQSLWLQTRFGHGDSTAGEIAWVNLPEKSDITFGWSPKLPRSVELKSNTSYPDPRLSAAAISSPETGRLPLQTDGSGTRTATLPYTLKSTAEPILFTVEPGDGSSRQIPLAWNKRTNNEPPVLFGLAGFSGMLGNFEKDNGTVSSLVPERMTIRDGDAQQGRYLQVQNLALNQRLNSTYYTRFSIATHPLFQFRYRASDMANLSASFSNHHYLRFGDDLASAVQARNGVDMIQDDSWHTWTGFAADAFTSLPFASTRFTPSYVTIGSAGSPDQTGRFSKCDLDDLVFGPAVATAEQLSFTPDYFDPDGVKTVFSSLHIGPATFASLAAKERAELKWTSHKPGEKVVPLLKGYADGVHHIFYKAVDNKGRESSVFDLPFLIDTTPLLLSHSFGSYTDPVSNGVQLSIAINTQSGSPWAAEKARFLIAGTERKISSWTNLFAHTPAAERLTLNYPYLLRKQLDDAKNGETVNITIDSISDGAGNTTPPYTIPVKLDYASDKVGPAWFTQRFGTRKIPSKTVFRSASWNGTMAKSLLFTVGRHNVLTTYNKLHGISCLRNQSYYGKADFSYSANWKPADFPWMSFKTCLPTYRGTLRYIVTLTTNAGNYTVSLISPKGGKRELGRGLHFPWKANHWVPIQFNTVDLLKKAGVADSTIASMTVSTITFSLRGCVHREIVYLDDFYLHAKPGEKASENRMACYAYDASGVAELEFEQLDAAEKTIWTYKTKSFSNIDLGILAAKVKDHSWFRVRARDHAGNYSTPAYLPVAGR